MSILVNLTPTEEARLATEATLSGLEASELAAKLLREHLMSEPVPSADMVRAKLRQWQVETETETFPTTSAHDLFAQWAQEDADKTDEEIAANDRLWEDYQEGIDDERRKAGMRTLFSA